MSETNRQLNIEVARFMGLVPCDGWKVVNFGSAGGPLLVGDNCPHKEGECYPTREVESMGGTFGGVPHYSTDIACAMQVFEKLRGSGEWCCLNIFSDFHYIYYVSLTRFDLNEDEESPHEPTIKARDESLPLAICRAALAALKEGTKDAV